MVFSLFLRSIIQTAMPTKKTTTKKEIAFEERMAKQRAKRGFSDRDVWSIEYWFSETISPMLKQLAKKKHGFQMLDEKGEFTHKDKLSEEDYKTFDKRWTDMLLHMAFLADEMSEENCSMKNPYDKDFHRIWRAFEKKYGSFGEKLLTDDEKKESQEKGYTKCYMPDEDPIHGEEYRKIMDLHSDYEKKIAEYRDKCKDEFFALFSKYFRCLWD